MRVIEEKRSLFHQLDTPRPRWLGVVERIAIAAAWLFVVSSWIGVTLAELGRFSGAGMLVLSTLALAALLLIARTLRARHRPDVAKSALSTDKPGNVLTPVRWGEGLEAALLLAILVVGAYLYFRPSEAIFATHDAGARINAAAHVAQSGRIPIQDPNLWTATSIGSLTTTIGLYAIDPPRGILLPQFSGVLEIWEALALTTLSPPRSLIFGYENAPSVFPQRPLYLPAIFADLALLVAYCALRRFAGASVSLASTAALALSYPEITFARLTMAEIPTQLFLMIAFCGLVRFFQESRAGDAALAGTAVGLAFLTHVDIIFLYVPISLWMLRLLAQGKWQRIHVAFFGPAFLLLVQGIGHYLIFEGPYVNSNLDSLLHVLPRSAPTVAVVVLAMLTLLWVWAEKSNAATRLASSQTFRWIAAGFVVALAFFAYVIRPMLDPAQIIPTQIPDRPLVRIGGITLVLLGRYLSPLTLFMALIGITTIIVSDVPRHVRALLWSGGLYLLVFGLNPLVSPFQPFWVRRFVPEVIPFLIISAAVGCLALSRRVPRPILSRFVQIGLLGVLVATTANIGVPLWRISPEFQGGIAETNMFAQSLPANSIVVFDRSEAASWLPLPLTFLFHRDSFVPQGDEIDPRRVNQAIQTWRQEGKTVVFVTSGGKITLDPHDWEFRPLTDQRFRFTAFPREFLQPPGAYDWVDFHVAAYEIVDPVQSAPVVFPFTLQLGRFDYGYLVSGFGPNNYSGQTSYRYTGDRAVVDLPRPPSPRARITIRMAGYRPDGAPPADLRLSVDSTPLGEIRFQSGGDPSAAFQNYTYTTDVRDVEEQTRLRLQFQVNSWRPADYGYGDTQEIGVAVEWIRVEGA